MDSLTEKLRAFTMRHPIVGGFALVVVGVLPFASFLYMTGPTRG